MQEEHIDVTKIVTALGPNSEEQDEGDEPRRRRRRGGRNRNRRDREGMEGDENGQAEGAEPAFTPVADQAAKEQVRSPKAPIEVTVKSVPETAAWEFPTTASMAAKHAVAVAAVAEQAAAVEVAAVAAAGCGQ